MFSVYWWTQKSGTWVSLHLGGYTTRRFEISGIKEALVMHIPLANFPSTSFWLKIWTGSSTEDATCGGTTKDGSKTNLGLNISWPEANRMPLYWPFSCKCKEIIGHEELIMYIKDTAFLPCQCAKQPQASLKPAIPRFKKRKAVADDYKNKMPLEAINFVV